jgi:hypothetical protein
MTLKADCVCQRIAQTLLHEARSMACFTLVGMNGKASSRRQMRQQQKPGQNECEKPFFVSHEPTPKILLTSVEFS